MKDWIELSGYVNWQDYGARWAKRARDGSWLVLDFCNMYGSDHNPEELYICEVKRVNLATLPRKELTNALRSCGWVLRTDGTVIDEHSGDKIGTGEEIIVEACLGYGCAEPLATESSAHSPIKVRGRARRTAKNLMHDTNKLETALSRPVNKIGSTAREYGASDLASAIERNVTPTGALIRKMYNNCNGQTLGGSNDQQ